MFDKLVNYALRNRLIVAVAALVLMFYGGFTLVRMPVDVFPDLNKPTVTVQAEAGGMAPEEVEQLITAPLETAMGGIPGVESIRSVSSRAGLRLRHLRLEDRHLPRPPDGGREAVHGARAVAGRRRARGDGPGELHHGLSLIHI